MPSAAVARDKLEAVALGKVVRFVCSWRVEQFKFILELSFVLKYSNLLRSPLLFNENQ